MRPCCTSFARTLWPSYLSFTTLTSTGLSDVVPVRAFARAVVMLEQLMGLGHVAMLVSRLVAQMVINRQAETEAG